MRAFPPKDTKKFANFLDEQMGFDVIGVSNSDAYRTSEVLTWQRMTLGRRRAFGTAG